MKPISKIDFPKMENEILSQWNKRDIFVKSNNGKKTYIFFDGPPFANGLPHYGHLLASTIKDSVCRYWIMNDYNIDRRFGWDCHGLPVEYEIQKKFNLNSQKDVVDFGISKFNEACRNSVNSYTNEWQKIIHRIGRWVDWERQYQTMDFSYMESVWWVFKELYKKGLIYKDKKIVAYSPKINAVVSNFEANENYKLIQDPAITVKFYLHQENAWMLVWTTTPWTLIANQALCVHPDFDYVLLKSNDQKFCCAKFAIDKLFPKKDYKIEFEFKGKDLLNKEYSSIFGNDKKFILTDSFVKENEGTGIVHIAPAFGEDDFRVGKQNGLEIYDPLNEDAVFVESKYKGKYIFDANKEIIKDLKLEQKIFKHETIMHNYPHCSRTNDRLIYRAISTWYLSVEKIKNDLVKNNQKINWVPSHFKDGRMGQWLENAQDWAISRNRFWGTPIPIWISEDETEIEVIGSMKELEEKSGEAVSDLHRHFIDNIIINKNGKKLTRIPEIFDCWFESGSMPYAQNHYPFENALQLPADFVAEGQDQTRGWFYTLNIISTAIFNQPAFKNVIVNGIVLAEDGLKMSKRLGNYTKPSELLEKYGADAVRLYMFNSAVMKSENLSFSDDGVKEVIKTILLPLQNSYNFLATYAQADNWKPSIELIQGNINKPKNSFDIWILAKLQILITNVRYDIENYRLYAVIPYITKFLDNLTNWYVRLNRRRFWESKETQHYETLFYAIMQLTKILCPFAPFITDYIYCNMTGQDSVHLTSYPKINSSLICSEIEEKIDFMQSIISLGRTLRHDQNIRMRQPLQEIVIITSEKDYFKDDFFINTIKQELNVKEIKLEENESKYVDFSFKPNFATLGKKFGKNLNDFIYKMKSISLEEMLIIIKQLEYDTVNIDNYQISSKDIIINRTPKGNNFIETKQNITVVLNPNLNQDLIEEGFARDLVHYIQNLRKELDLNVSDRIKLYIGGTISFVEKAKKYENYIMNEVLSKEIVYCKKRISGKKIELNFFETDGIKDQPIYKENVESGWISLERCEQ